MISQETKDYSRQKTRLPKWITNIGRGDSKSRTEEEDKQAPAMLLAAPFEPWPLKLKTQIGSMQKETAESTHSEGDEMIGRRKGELGIAQKAGFYNIRAQEKAKGKGISLSLSLSHMDFTLPHNTTCNPP